MPHILVVDDEEPVRYLVKRIIEKSGYRIGEARSAEEALSAFEKEPIDLVVTDLRMRGADGLWLAQELLKRDPDLPIILATGYANLGSAQKAIGVGIYDYLTKPLDLHALQSSIARGVEYRRLKRENRAYQRDLEKKVEERTQDLERAYQELIQSEKLTEVGRLAAGVVHEVLNPLTVVMGRLELLSMDTGLSEKQHRSLQMGMDQLRRAVRIMNNLREFSRQGPSKRSATYVNDIISHTLEFLSHPLRDANVKVETNFDKLPSVIADSDQLAQVFLNLIKNAIEAMPEGGTLNVLTRQVVQPKKQGIAIDVQDSGEGISQENLAYIFDMFFTTKQKGTGLGLGICRGIVEAHGGELTVQTELGAGTSFTIFLPVEAVDPGKPNGYSRGGKCGSQDSHCR